MSVTRHYPSVHMIFNKSVLLSMIKFVVCKHSSRITRSEQSTRVPAAIPASLAEEEIRTKKTARIAPGSLADWLHVVKC